MLTIVPIIKYHNDLSNNFAKILNNNIKVAFKVNNNLMKL